MNRLRTFYGMLLAVLIALNSVSMSLARVQMRDQSGAIVLCTGTGLVTVPVDSLGKPIGSMPICPDCALGFFDYFADALPTFHLTPVQLAVSYAFRNAHLLGRAPAFARARGPPLA